MISPRIRKILRPAGFTVVGIVVGLLIGAVAGAPALGYVDSFFHVSESPAAPAYPLWCSDPNPQSGYNYSVVYVASSGTITSFSGQTGNGSPIPGNGEAVLHIGTGSFSNLTLIHSMFCYAEEGHAGAWPFHVDLSTDHVVWD